MPRKRVISAAAFSLAVAGGGVAGALLGTPSLGAAQESDTTTTTAEGDTTTGENSREDGRWCGRHHLGVRARLDVAAEAIGISNDELRDALRDGATIAEVAEEHSVDVQTVVDALVADATERIEEAMADLDERMTDFVNRDFEGRWLRGPFGRPHR